MVENYSSLLKQKVPVPWTEDYSVLVFKAQWTSCFWFSFLDFVVIPMMKEERHYLKKVWLKQTLEIPCFEDATSENLSTYPLKWLVVSIFHLRYKVQKELQGIFANWNENVLLYCVLPAESAKKTYQSYWTVIIKGKSITIGLQNIHST